MAFKTSSSSKGAIFNEINITPLTDIFLVLLIIMMVVAPSFQAADNSINVPEINSGIAIEQKNATVSITKEAQYFINGNPIKSETVVTELEKLKPSLEKKEVVVKADASVKSSEIMNVMRAAQQAGFEKLIVAGEPLTKKEQKELSKPANTSATKQTRNKLPKNHVPVSSRGNRNTPGELPKE